MSEPARVETWEVVELLQTLVDKSLVVYEEDDQGQGRYRLLESIGQYAQERLIQAEETDTIRRLHGTFFRQVAEDAQPKLRGRGQFEARLQLQIEYANLRQALYWCQECDVVSGLRLAGALVRFWEVTSALREGSEWLEKLLDHPAAQLQTLERASALHGAGLFHLLQARYTQAEMRYQQAYTLFSALNDVEGQGAAKQGLANIALYEQKYEEAQQGYTECLALFQAAADERGMAAAYHNLGNVQMRLDNTPAARVYMEQAVEIRRRLNDQLGVAQSLGALAQLARKEDRLEEALACCCEILPIFHSIGITWAMALCFNDMAHIAWEQGALWRAALLLGVTATLRDESGFAMPPAEQQDHHERLLEMRAELGSAVFESAWNEGRTLPLEQAVGYALSEER